MQKGNYLYVFSQHNVQTMHAVTEKTALNRSTTSPVCVKQVFLGRGVNQVWTKRFLIQFVHSLLRGLTIDMTIKSYTYCMHFKIIIIQHPPFTFLLSAVSCDKLSEPSHGRMKCSGLYGSYSLNSSCQFFCTAGSKLSGTADLHCNSSGAWSAPPPTCAGTKYQWSMVFNDIGTDHNLHVTNVPLQWNVTPFLYSVVA